MKKVSLVTWFKKGIRTYKTTSKGGYIGLVRVEGCRWIAYIYKESEPDNLILKGFWQRKIDATNYVDKILVSAYWASIGQ